MTVSSLRVHWLAVLAVLAVGTILTACIGSPAPAPEPNASPIATPEPDTAEEGGSVASDRAALVALYNATGGASWRFSTNWLSDRPLGAWHGVTTTVSAVSLWCGCRTAGCRGRAQPSN